MTARIRRLTTALVAASLFLGAVLVIGASSARADEIPVVPDGCVLTGGGVACGAGSEINEPTEPPAEEPAEPEPAPEPVEPILIEVTTAPPAPTSQDPCGPDNVAVTLPSDPGPWLYTINADPVGGSGYVQAYLPDTHVIGGTGELAGERSWYPVFEWRDTETPCPAKAPVPAPPTPETGEPAAPVVPDELAVTGTEEAAQALPYAAAFILAGVAALAIHRRRHA